MKADFTVTGPDAEAKAPSAETGLSKAINFASRAAKARREATFYVRNKAGDATGRVEAYADGSCTIFGGAS